MKTKRSICTILASLAILLTGCNGNSNSGSSSSAETSGTTTASSEPMQTTTSDSGSETEPQQPTTESTQPEEPSAEPASTEPQLPPAETVESPERPEITIYVDYAQVENVNGSSDTISITDSETQVNVMISAYDTVTDLKILSLTCENIDDNGNITFAVSEVYSQPELAAGSYIVAGMEFFGLIPNNGISYVDTDGVEKRYAIDMSGEDGSLFLWEF